MPASRRSLSVSFLLRSSVLAVSTLLQLLTTTAGHDSGGRCEAFHAVHMVSTSVSSSLFCMKYLALRSGMSDRSEEHTSELQSLMRISYAVFCLKKKKKYNTTTS